MKKKKMALLGGAAAVLLAACAGGFWLWNHRTASDDEQRVYVTTVSTLTGDVAGTQNRYAGIVEPQRTVTVKVEGGRKVKELKVHEGDAVTVGTVLFEYDASSAEDDLAQATLDLDRYKNEEQSLRNQIETLKAEKEKASDEEQLSYTIEIQSTEMDLKKNEYDQKSKQAEIDKINRQSGELEVRSELDGVVKSINDSIPVGSSQGSDDDSGTGGSGRKTNFITIVATGTYRVKGVINETNMSSIQEGEPVIVRSRVNADLVWKGTMTGVDTSEPEKDDDGAMFMDSGDGDEQTTSSNYPFYVELDSADGLILGQHVYIEPDNGQTELREGLWLDEFYIVDPDAPEPYVWASDNRDRLEKRFVSLGDYDGEMGQYQILDGLTENDCIAFPEENLEEGMPTAIEEEMQTPSEEEEDPLESGEGVYFE